MLAEEDIELGSLKNREAPDGPAPCVFLAKHTEQCRELLILTTEVIKQKVTLTKSSGDRDRIWVQAFICKGIWIILHLSPHKTRPWRQASGFPECSTLSLVRREDWGKERRGPRLIASYHECFRVWCDGVKGESVHVDDVSAGRQWAPWPTGKSQSVYPVWIELAGRMLRIIILKEANVKHVFLRLTLYT